jgi:DUF4097 and DUF4098 domain-containing protein YvlB
MSKTTKLVLIIATVSLTLGIVVAGSALALVGFDFSRLSTVTNYEQRNYVSTTAGITAIEFDGISDDVRVERANVKTVEVDYWENDRLTYEITSTGGTLRIAANYEWQGELLNFDLGFTDTTVVIRIPADFTGSLTLKTTSGEIKTGDLGTLSALQISTVSGGIRVNSTVTGSITLKTTSGDIVFEKLTASNIKLSTVSGEITGTILGAAAGYNIQTSSISGDIRVPQGSAGAAKSLEAHTTSGDIRISFSN